jgi:hypothetical protein
MTIIALMRSEGKDTEIVMEACDPGELGRILVSLSLLAEEDDDFDFYLPCDEDCNNNRQN